MRHIVEWIVRNGAIVLQKKSKNIGHKSEWKTAIENNLKFSKNIFLALFYIL